MHFSKSILRILIYIIHFQLLRFKRLSAKYNVVNIGEVFLNNHNFWFGDLPATVQIYNREQSSQSNLLRPTGSQDGESTYSKEGVGVGGVEVDKINQKYVFI